MKLISKYSKLWILAVIVIASCKPEQDVAPIDPSTAVVTIEADGDYSSVSEGDVLTYTLTITEVPKTDVQFDVVLNGDGVNERDYSVSGGVLRAWESTAQISITIVSDGFPEDAESFAFQIDASGDEAHNYVVSPDSDVEATTVSLSNTFAAESITIGAEWEDPEHHNDFDLLVYLAGDGAAAYSGATGANPESQVLPNTINDQTIYVDFDPYAIGDDMVNFDLRIGLGDGSFQSYTGVWDSSKSYETGPFGTIAVFEIVKSGSSYTVDFVFAEAAE